MLRKLAVMAACTGLWVGAKAPERPLQVITTDLVDFTGGGTIRVNDTYGQLNVEGWDEPRVEITVTRTAFRHDSQKDREEGTAYLNLIKVTARKAGSGDVEISTQFPGRSRMARLIRGLGDFNLDYRIKVPRTAKLAIRQGVGDVMVQGVAGNIDVSVRSGDIVVQLADPQKYAIDAQCRLGNVYTDFDGAYGSPFRIGQKFDAGAGEAHTVRLRVLVGGISIQRSPSLQPAEPGS